VSSKLIDDSEAPAGRPSGNVRPRFVRGARRDERGGMRLWRIPGARRLPGLLAEVEQDLVLFDSWGGRFSDNPRALSEALHRRGAPLHQVWVRSARADGPSWATKVLTGSREHLACMRRARYIVANNTLPGFFRKRRSTTYLQTWHGTPLKRIAFDMPFDHSRQERAYLSHLDVLKQEVE